MEILKKSATCHCGAVELELLMPNGFEKPRRCTCSICRRKGAVVISVKRENLKVVRGEDNLQLYTFNTHVARHYFCKTCGIYTHHLRRSDPSEYGVNSGCIEGVDPFAFTDVPVHDGQNHPSDR
ncbi:MAG: GFA family protein [Pseudomonadota bacterium]